MKSTHRHDEQARAASVGDRNNPLWVITAGMAVFFAVMAALIAIG